MQLDQLRLSGIESQRDDRDHAEFKAYVVAAVKAIRRASKTVPILAGLATDAGGIPVTAADMVAEYKLVYSMVQGYWLNADQWNKGPADGCERVGCPLVADKFLADIGIKATGR